MKQLTIVCIILCTIVSKNTRAQEQLRSILSNHQISEYQDNIKSGNSVLAVPFLDDFHYSSDYPDQTLWIDADGFVNTNYGDDSPGIGTLTLDAMDSTGAIYARANTTGFIADHLTSKAINLDFGADTTVYLSFYYQPQGLGDAPEPGDSLVLEFYAQSLDEWVWMWSVPGSENHDFEQVLIPVRGALFLSSGFQFRFKNYASLADALEPSLISNADHWHLDYIYLDRNRHYQDVFMNDLCIQRNTGSLLLNYTALPWRHFQEASINEVSTIFPVHIKNLSNSEKFFEPVFTIEDLLGSTDGFTRLLSADNLNGGEELKYDATFNYGFTSDAADSALFSVELDIQPTEEDLIPGNSKATYQQIFSDYYAYDDGTAENGYGLAGEATNNALIAVRFENFIPGDSLKGVSIFFNRSFEDANIKYFDLAVWNEIDGLPGEMIYHQAGVRSSNDQGLTGFDYFPFDTSQVVPEVYYVGIKQVTTDFLNIGFDLNTHHEDQIFYRTGLNWRNTSFSGSLMIRPVFANISKKTSIQTIDNDLEKANVLCYPNPASDLLNIEIPDYLSDPVIRIVNMTGQMMIEKRGRIRQINISRLPSGNYFILVQSQNNTLSNRFIKL